MVLYWTYRLNHTHAPGSIPASPSSSAQFVWDIPAADLVFADHECDTPRTFRCYRLSGLHVLSSPRLLHQTNRRRTPFDPRRRPVDLSSGFALPPQVSVHTTCRTNRHQRFQIPSASWALHHSGARPADLSSGFALPLQVSVHSPCRANSLMRFHILSASGAPTYSGAAPA